MKKSEIWQLNQKKLEMDQEQLKSDQEKLLLDQEEIKDDKAQFLKEKIKIKLEWDSLGMEKQKFLEQMSMEVAASEIRKRQFEEGNTEKVKRSRTKTQKFSFKA